MQPPHHPSGLVRRMARRLRDARPLLLGLAATAALAGGLLVSGAGVGPASAAKAPRLIATYHVYSVGCVPGPANTVRARVKLRMKVINYSGIGDWADHMEAKARLEPTTAGTNFMRSWVSWKTPYLVQDRVHSYNISLTTDNVSGTAAWRLHLKMIWHRPAPIFNVKKDLMLNFNGSCATTTGGGGPINLNPTPALPSPNGS